MLHTTYAGDSFAPAITNQTENSNIADSDVAPDPYYPFIYDPEWNYAWLGESLADAIAELYPGYLYVANINTKSVELLLDTPVVDYECNTESIFAVTESNQIIRTDYLGSSDTVIYESASGDIKALEYENHTLYFADGNRVLSMCIQSQNTETILILDNVIYIFPYHTDKLLLKDDAANVYTYDVLTGILSVVEDECATDELLNSTIQTITHIDYDSEAHLASTDSFDIAMSVMQPSLPMESYEVGDFFTTTGNACINHNSCKRYASTNQCDGFARYVNEHYYHVEGSTWSTPYSVPGDVNAPYSKYQAFTNTTTLYQFFNNLTRGAYVRVSKRNEEQDAVPPHTSQGSHSYVYVSHDSNGAVLYEANLNNTCEVNYGYRTFDELLSRYPYFFGWVNHTPAGRYALGNSDYHKEYCSHDGCSAYIFKAHTYIEISTGYKCYYCGHLTKTTNGPTIVE